MSPLKVNFKMASITVGSIVRSMLPSGTFAGPTFPGKPTSPSWDYCPIWPPDVFAIAATLLERSGAYAEPGVAFPCTAKARQQKLYWSQYAKDIGGPRWRDRVTPVPKAVSMLWTIIYRRFATSICDDATSSYVWKVAALRLVAISDEACVAFGWLPDGTSRIAFLYFRQYLASMGVPRGARFALQLPHSLCFMIPSEIVCVQPKANTPRVGCTVRSLSHHIALLPGRGVVSTEWRMPYVSPSRGVQKSPIRQDIAFNILCIPFPYVLHGKSFVVTRRPADGRDGYFCVRQDWLNPKGVPLKAEQLADFTLDLMRQSRNEAESVNCVVFPEASLTPKLIDSAVRIIASRDKSVELIIAGAIRTEDGRQSNEAHVFALANGKVRDHYVQHKHHRWLLDEDQITNYNLGNALHPGERYWEEIDLGVRKLHFGMTKGDAVVAALICEDLARADPVMPALSAIGPNLVIALLMDGPQLIGRWSSRYATVLADDPGAAILTLTCLGMVLRSRVPNSPLPGSIGRRCVGLWREPNGKLHELDLPADAEGLILSLSSHAVSQVTLDGRDDGMAATKFSLSAVRKVQASHRPDWLEFA